MHDLQTQNYETTQALRTIIACLQWKRYNIFNIFYSIINNDNYSKNGYLPVFIVGYTIKLRLTKLLDNDSCSNGYKYVPKLQKSFRRYNVDKSI